MSPGSAAPPSNAYSNWRFRRRSFNVRCATDREGLWERSEVPIGDLFAPEHRDERAGGEERTERDRAPAASPRQDRDDPPETAEQDGRSRGDAHVAQPERPHHQADQARELDI